MSPSTRRGEPVGKTADACGLVTLAYIAWSLLPVLVAIQFSFNVGSIPSDWQGFSTRWYLHDAASVARDDSLRLALDPEPAAGRADDARRHPVGGSAGPRSRRWRGRGARAANVLMLVPLVTPEIVMGVALFLVFANLYDFVPFGTWAQFLGHVTFSISFVVIIVRGRLFAIGRDYEEAAMDLGASPGQALRQGPASVAGSRHLLLLRHRVRHLDRRLRHQPIPGRRSIIGHDSGAALLGGPHGARRRPLNALATLMLVFDTGRGDLAGLVICAVTDAERASPDSAVAALGRFDI